MPLYRIQDASDNFVSSTTGNTVTVDTTSTGALEFYGVYGSIDANSYHIGQTAETHTHNFSEDISSFEIEFGAVSLDTAVTIYLDGVAVDLNTLIASGELTLSTLSGTNPFSINAAGQLIGIGAFGSTNIGLLTFNLNTPVSDISIESAADPAGWLYELSVDTATTLPVICFVRGTRILTADGNCPIEALHAGDLVKTLDHGFRPLRWIGSNKRVATGDFAPILIRKGALGNTRDLRVSPQHQMMLSGWMAEMLFGESEVFASAKSLINDHSITRDEGGEVEYFHMLFERHEIIFSEGIPSESFHLGKMGWRALDQATRVEILTLFPELAQGGLANGCGPAARKSLKHHEGRLLAQYVASERQMRATSQLPPGQAG